METQPLMETTVMPTNLAHKTPQAAATIVVEYRPQKAFSDA
jgi:hypothetical protein